MLQDAIACELGARALAQSRHELVLRDGLRLLVGGGGCCFEVAARGMQCGNIELCCRGGSRQGVGGGGEQFSDLDDRLATHWD